MPIFADSFWSDDLSSGLKLLFEKLYQGCEQCDLFIQLFASRMQFEVTYGRQLGGIKSGVDHLDKFSSDPEATVLSSLHEIIDHTSQEGNQHLAIASNIETLVLAPFSKWCADHRKRVEYSEKMLKSNVANFDKSRNYVSKLEREYFNRCRQLEDYKKANYENDDELIRAMKSLQLQQKYEKDLAREREYQNFATVGNIEFDHKSMREAIQLLLTKLPKSEYKMPFINYTLENTNSGSEITNFLLQNMSLKDLDQAEVFGQDLINLGFLKYCNGVGNTFVNSKKFQYQWKGYAYRFVDLPRSADESDLKVSSMEPRLSAYLQDFTLKMPPTGATDNSDDAAATEKGVVEPLVEESEKMLFKLMKEVAAADRKYYRECFKMDSLRCSVEELIIDHLSFMERCELDRLKAVKKATFDFCATVSNKISNLKICVDNMIQSEANMDPNADLLHFLMKYRTGYFQPRAITYNNYYNPGAFQNFGIDLETRCRLDKKVVPLIASVILSYMDQVYPEMSSDKVRISVWTAPVKLNLSHQLRNLLNRKQFRDDAEVLEVIKSSEADASTVASVLKIYLLELPEPLISNDIYDVLKMLYTQYTLPSANTGVDTPGASDDPPEEKEQQLMESHKIRGLYTTLSSLPKPHIATLDAITTHFCRLIKILKMGDEGQEIAAEFTQSISQEFANCIIQVRLPDGNDLGYKIFYDLLTHKKEIFGELKRQGSRAKNEK
ncbi:RGD2 (YFL047W) [Zygosaccharomyces parabailii]|nr:RGD2 (YFL047W) [Zygosaccharomyces parabailii]CDH09605.1 probable Rho-GTPase-activating protein RGD2 [Zygosaccharomyces bailii ISA1307]